MKYLIIGNGVAGMEAALAIRKNDPDGAVTMISASRHLYYYRPKVIDYLAGETTADKLVIYKKDYYEKNSIEVLLDTVIKTISPGRQEAQDDKGAVYSYDKLLLSTGAYSFIPPIKGAGLEGVFTLRGIADADAIREYCSGRDHVLVIGGGLLGLEAAHSLVRLGKRVTVVEFCRWLLPRQLDMTGSKILSRMLEEKGFSFILNDSVLSIEGSGRAEKAVLQSGTEVKAGAAVISAGIRCRTDLAKDAGINVNNGIIVDDYMQTSVKNIFAAGDPVEHRGKLYGIWPAAKEQGRIAGLNMSGGSVRYNGTLMSNVLKITGIDLYSAGTYDAPGCEILVSENPGTYKKFLLNINNPVGAIVLGDAQAIKVARKVIDGKAMPEEFRKLFA